MAINTIGHARDPNEGWENFRHSYCNRNKSRARAKPGDILAFYPLPAAAMDLLLDNVVSIRYTLYNGFG
jgi:hypothetical protein